MHRSLDKSVTKAIPAAADAVRSGVNTGVAGNAASGGDKVSGEDQASGGDKDSTGAVSAEKTIKSGGSGSSVAGSEKVLKTRTSDIKTANAGATQNSVGVERQDVVNSAVVHKGISGRAKVLNLRTRSGAAAMVGQSGLVGTAGKLQNDGSEGKDHNNVSLRNSSAEDPDPLPARLDSRRTPIGERNGINVDVVAPKVPGDSQKPGSSRKHSGSHGYIGVFGAPDFSTVRFQAMKGVGTTFGIILGYSFNNRWAIETGLSMDRKRYYTAGEYFKKEMPAGYTLKNVDGTCNMLEIPLNVRYNFSTGPRMKWFATAGLSTYLMSQENYNYQVEYNWVTEDSMWNIHKPSQYWFSIVNLSAGFEQRVGKIGSLRLEPYVRIPLSGIGTGKLPIVSGGLNIGLVRDLW
jgi:hypothetical protein